MERRLLNFGKLTATYDKENRYRWPNYEMRECIYKGAAPIVPSNQVILPSDSPLILDIDLDAFCCHRTDTLRFLPTNRKEYDGVFGFEKRIDQTIDILTTLPRPNLITIASSEGDRKQLCFVPPFMLKEVSDYLAVSLKNVYV
ncbi:hypothetical protein HYZ76_01140 [Candidatus Falkowbacteria bacterium]|nr:hypothetical protein [Candidatus Falkowbacteria bacterium]